MSSKYICLDIYISNYVKKCQSIPILTYDKREPEYKLTRRIIFKLIVSEGKICNPKIQGLDLDLLK
jgi:hypothetical protein